MQVLSFLVSSTVLMAMLNMNSLQGSLPANVSNTLPPVVSKESIQTGADQIAQYLPYLKGKKVGILANQTTVIGEKHMVDSLRSLGINIVAVLGLEHGFRGNARNGARVEAEVDSATGIPIISLYGEKPSKTDLDGIDVMLFDIQDDSLSMRVAHC